MGTIGLFCHRRTFASRHLFHSDFCSHSLAPFPTIHDHCTSWAHCVDTMYHILYITGIIDTYIPDNLRHTTRERGWKSSDRVFNNFGIAEHGEADKSDQRRPRNFMQSLFCVPCSCWSSCCPALRCGECPLDSSQARDRWRRMHPWPRRTALLSHHHTLDCSKTWSMYGGSWEIDL